MDDISLVIGWYVVFLVSIIFHEAAHGLAAATLGDRTAYHHGLITLDPVPHMKRSPFGMVVLPIISFFAGGWMLGWASTPYDPYWAREHRKKAAIMSLAGPAANLILVILAALLIRGGMLMGLLYAPDSITFSRVTASNQPGLANALSILLSILFSLNLILLVFNLIPLPPLDGSNILSFFLSEKSALQYNNFLRQPAHQLIGLIIAWQLFAVLFGPVHGFAINLLYPGLNYY
jgi:Zn-dependent protease